MWMPPVLDELPQWSLYKRIAIDCETHDPQLKKLGCGAQRDGRLIGYSFAMDGKAFYVPLRHEEGGNVDEAQGLAYLKDQMEAFTGEVVGANLPYDLRYLVSEGIDISGPSSFRDVQVAAPLLDENQEHYSLQAIAERLGLSGKDETELIAEAKRRKLNPKADLWKLHSGWVGQYAEMDALLPLQLIDLLEADIEKQQLQRIYKLECELLPVLLRMTLRGIRIDEQHLDDLETEHIVARQKSLDEFNYETGLALGSGDLNNKGAISRAMDRLGIEYGSTVKGEPEITSAFLLNQGKERPVLNQLVAAKRSNKMLGSFIQSVRAHAINGRIHASFNQLRRVSDWGSNNYGTVSGRLSSTNPNMQQQPSSKEWRKVYLPEEGEDLASIDYSSQELRIAVHYALMRHDRSAKKVAAAYQADPRADMYQIIADLAKVDRKVAKTVVLGTMYGMGAGKLAKNLGLAVLPEKESFVNASGELIVYDKPGPEAQAMFDRIHYQFPWMKNLKNIAMESVDKRIFQSKDRCGFVLSILGRRCRFPQKRAGTYKALNRIIQASAADQMKQALVDLDKAGIRTLASIHDEVICSVSNRDDIARAGEIMTNAVKLNVPVVVDTAIGRSWGEMEEVR